MGVETLPQRMREHVANAQRVAAWLEADERVSWVRYSGLPSHSHHALAQQYLPEGPGAVFSFGVAGGRAAGERFIDSVQLCSHLANIGDARTLVLHPASTTHQQLSADQLQAAGVPRRPHPHQRRPRGRRGRPVGPRPGPRRGREGELVTDPQTTTTSASDTGTVAAPENLREQPAATGSKDAPATTWKAPSAGNGCASCAAQDRRDPRASNKPSRASYFVETYLLADSDFELWFVNPNETEVLGRPAYPSLAELPGVPDLVDVFRRPSELDAVLDDVNRRRFARDVDAARAGRRGRRPARRRARSHRRHEPLPEDRARPVPRRAAPRRVRHRGDLRATPVPLTTRAPQARVVHSRFAGPPDVRRGRLASRA